MKLTGYEMETIILYNQAEPNAQVYTHDAKLIAKLRRLHEASPEKVYLQHRLARGFDAGATRDARLHRRGSAGTADHDGFRAAKAGEDQRCGICRVGAVPGFLSVGKKNPFDRNVKRIHVFYR